MSTVICDVAIPALRCPSCQHSLSEIPQPDSSSIRCPECQFAIIREPDYWDACPDRSYPRDFARQWVLWEAGKLGDPTLVYGYPPEHYFEEFLSHVSLSPSDLASMRILEVGFGHGRLLRQVQSHCRTAFGLDLATPLRSAQLRSGSVFFGNLLQMPFTPGQFDLVICRGVVHHTPDPQASFQRVAEQVAPGGMFYFAGCYEPGRKTMLKIRKVFRRSWTYPEPILLALSEALSDMRAVLQGMRTRDMSLRALRSYSQQLYKLDIFDVLTPRWSGTLGADTVLPWFASCGLHARKVGDGSYVGIR